VLDYGGAAQKLGKNVGDDFREGKIHLAGRAGVPPRLRRRAANSGGGPLERGEASRPPDLEHAIGLMPNTAALEDTIGRAPPLRRHRRDALALFPDSPMKSALAETVDFCIARRTSFFSAALIRCFERPWVAPQGNLGRRGRVVLGPKGGCEADLMESRDLPQHDNGDPQPAATHPSRPGRGAAEAAGLNELPSRSCCGSLLSRAAVALRERGARLATGFCGSGERGAKPHAAASPGSDVQCSCWNCAPYPRSPGWRFAKRARRSFARWRPRRAVTWLAVAALLPAAYLIDWPPPFRLPAACRRNSRPAALVVRDEYGRPFATAASSRRTDIAGSNTADAGERGNSIEDRRFYQHRGVDLHAMTRAAWHDLLGRRIEAAAPSPSSWRAGST